MVSEVNKLIFNTLITSGGVLLPEVGTIFIERKPATALSKKRISAPRYELSFSSHRSATSIVDSIQQATNISEKEALDIYGRWLDKVSIDGVVTIEGVGVLHNKSFVADSTILSQLNPLNSAVIEVVTKKNRVALYLALLLLIPTIIAGVKYFVLPNDNEQENEIVAEISETEVVPQPEQIVTPIVEEVDIVTEEVELIEPVIEQIIQEPEPEVIDDWRENSDIRHWAVIGSYSTEENVNRAIATLEKQHPYLKFSSFKLGSMYAVSPFGSTDREACEEFVSNYSDDFKQIWIHTPKRYKE
ncbi:MAG: hypothetical protein IKY74_01010 [Alistipes sp.]|nr:hypothetical protein [Alistipes sp.]